MGNPQKELIKYARNGSSFLENVAEEGVVLYDDEPLPEFVRVSLRRANKVLLAAKSLLEKDLYKRAENRRVDSLNMVFRF
ncbi:MAG: hypothetical protein B9J98_03330 [Candidatus Terraquivivens tikiterensis]|uniref:Uncharacterized protein n=1 Tax=Candidatus Terraquivivens tikiterensis TaxID=1980982 RepID=A0A2R7Y5W5_9ARCH|nr:MAG: hypothetical protein B9J98_03330 [Candidatus Terraquivivens tikiterensis]